MKSVLWINIITDDIIVSSNLFSIYLNVINKPVCGYLQEAGYTGL